MYVSELEYRCMSPLRRVDVSECDIQRAESDIDGLTFNRIRARGFDSLTEFQRDLVKRAVVEQVDFRFNFADMLENPLANYSINGVSIAWDNNKIVKMSGIYTTSYIYGLLRQTGFTYRGV